MLMLLNDILVLSSLSCKRQRIWYCIESIAIDRARVDHTDLEVSMRVRFPQGITQTIVCYRGLLGSQRLTGLLGYPVTLSKIIRVSQRPLCKAVNLADGASDEDDGQSYPMTQREDQERNIVLWRGQKIGNMDLVQFLRLLVQCIAMAIEQYSTDINY